MGSVLIMSISLANTDHTCRSTTYLPLAYILGTQPTANEDTFEYRALTRIVDARVLSFGPLELPHFE